MDRTLGPAGRRTRILAFLGLVAIAEFTLAVVALHAVSLDAEPSFMSQFAHSRFWLVWALGLYTLVLGCGALTWALRPCLQRTRCQRAGMALLALAGLAAFVLATFPVDAGRYESTLVGTIHNDATMTTFLMVASAMLVLAPAFRATPGWRSFAKLSLAIGVAVGCLGILYMVATEADLAIAALAQRVLVGCIAAWFTLVALRLRRLPGPVRPSVPLQAVPAVAGVGAQAAPSASNSAQSRRRTPRAPVRVSARGRTRSM